jgi:hypothetical protein
VNAKTAGDVAGLPAGTNVLTRLGGIKKAAVTGNSLADSASTVSATEAPSEGNHLLSALARVDRLAEAGNEYLIRVEHSEALPKVMLTCNYPATETDTVAVRLRGLDSGARTITYDDIGLGYSYPNGKTPATTASDFGRGIINIGDHRSDSTYTAYITLALENNITLAGKGSEYTDSANTTAMVQAGKHTTFIMRNGSKITGYYNINENTYNSVVLLLEDLSSEPGKEKGFKMQGGEITGNTTHIETGSVVTFHSDGQPSVGITHFTKTGGRIYDNTPNHFIASLILQQSKYAIPDGNTGTWPISQGDLVN